MPVLKKIASLLLAAALAASLGLHSSAAAAGFGNFEYADTYKDGQFIDVQSTEWYAGYVADACNFGFINGKSESVFDPGGILTLGEAVTLAARIRAIYYTGVSDFPSTVPYYTAYANYALEHGMISSHLDYTAPATRAQLVRLFYNALPKEAFPEINNIPMYSICDVTPDMAFGPAVYAFYRAGILTGSDRYGTFFPDSNITRAETSALAVRLVDPAFRISTVLPSFIDAEVIFQRSCDAAIMLETFDSKGASIRTGSAFFISREGFAITCLHVFDDASSATITLYSGETYPVKGVHAISEENNLAVFSIDSDRGDWSCLPLADSDLLEEGNTVYTIGSPRGLLNTMTEGVISKTIRDPGKDTLIQFTAPISFGSGGSAVLNTLGQVIGVASSSYSYGQNLNLAVPVNHIKALEPGKCLTLEELLIRNGDD